jgi:nitrogen fixation protein NifQ
MKLASPPEILLFDRALAGVLRSAQNGMLPPFALTLGLPRNEWHLLVEQSGSSVGASIDETRFVFLRSAIPQTFRDLVDLLTDNASPASDLLRTRWAAHVVATACFGDRHLWEELGLSGGSDVSMLLDHYFQPLHQRNTANLRWKRFLFLELGARHGETEKRPPGCARCGDFPLCFGDSRQG